MIIFLIRLQIHLVAVNKGNKMSYIIMDISDFINGLFALIVVIVGAIIGIRIILKYRKVKNKTLLYWGVSWCGFYQPWWGAAISFISAIFTQQTIPDQLYMFLGTFFIPIFVISWWYGLTELFLKDLRKKIVIIYLLIHLSFNVYVIIALMINPTDVGEIVSFDVQYESVTMIYLLFINFTMVITGLLFARDTRKSTMKEPRVKSLFMIAAFLSYLIGGLADATIIASTSDVALIIFRLILMSGAILFYIGLFLPTFVKKRLKLEDK